VEAPRAIGRYTLLGRIARGGMAELHLARADGPAGFEKLVALKLVLPHLADDPQFIAMFLDEARLAARLDHPHIAHVLDLECIDGRHVIVMEYVHGRDLRAVLTAAARKSALPLACALTILRDACAALHYAHELRGADGRPLGIVHRDVSPQNLVIRYDGVTKLVDFGVAKASTHASVTRTGMLKGKLGYMSPEHCLGKPIDRRSDVFALGIVAYEATTGLRLFHGDNEAAIINRIVEARFEPPCEAVPGYPAALEAVVVRALQRDPAKRFATAQEMLDALDDAIAAMEVRASHAAVGAEMTALFGDVPYPSHELETAPGTTATSIGTSLQSRSRARSRNRTLALALGLGGSLCVAGYVLGSVRGGDGEPTAGAADEPVRAAPASAPVTTPTVPTPAEPSPPIAAEAPSEPASVPAVEPTRARSEPRDRSRARKRKTSAPPAEPRAPVKPAPGSSPDSMMPRG
jgi:serine/threonine-protein kinase